MDVTGFCCGECSVEGRDGLGGAVVARFGRRHDHSGVHDDTAVREFLDDELSVLDPEPGERYPPSAVDVEHDPSGSGPVFSHTGSILQQPAYGKRGMRPSGAMNGRVAPMAEHDFKVTSEFVAVYESLDVDAAVMVDEAVMRLLEDHETAWARQGRVAGNIGEAWILEIRTPTSDISVYWDYLDGRLLLLILLIVLQS